MATTPPEAANPYPTVLVASLSMAAGFLVTAGQVHPTDYTRWDIALVGLLAGVCIHAATEAPWWALAGAALAAAVATGVDGDWTLTGFAIGALLLALVTVRYWLPLVAGGSAALTIGVLCRLGDGPFFGATSAFALAVIVSLFLLSIGHHPKSTRRVTWVGLSTLGLLMVVGAVGFAVSAGTAIDAVSRGNDAAKRGISALKDGDFGTAATLLDRASVAFADAQEQLDSPWSKIGRVVPVVAQNRATALRVIDSAAEVTVRAHVAADQIDPDRLRIVDGAVDLAAVTALAGPVDDLQTAIIDLQNTLDEPVSGWVPQPVTDRIADVQDDVDRYRASVDNLSLTVHAAPGLLGADRPRRYFIAFGQPAESRSAGGFVGNHAVITMDNGAISLTEFGRSDELRLAAPPEGMAIDMPDDFFNRYGQFNFVSASNGLVEPIAWKNISISPDIPTMTSLVQQMWAATFDTTIDGLIYIDPFTVQQLLEYTGPQIVEGYTQPIDSANAADFILREQYLLFPQEQRVDLLEVLAQQTIQSLLGGTMPGPLQLAKDLGPFVGEHRLAMFTDQPDEQRMFDAVGLSGRFPVSEGDADFGITFNNAGPNKLDAYLQHTVTTETRFDDDLGIDVVDVTLQLTNTAPAEGLSTYIAGNSSGLPLGTNLMYLSMYTPIGVVGGTQDGEPIGLDTQSELGAVVASTYLDIAPGATTTITITFEAAGPEPEGGWNVFVAPTAQRDT